MLGKRTCRRVAAVAAAVGLAAGLGGASAEADHCRPIIMFSGYSAADTAGPKLNPGVAGCPFVNHEDENTDTNYFLPGANSVSVGLVADPKGVERPAEGATATVTAGAIEITYLAASQQEVTFTEAMDLTWSGTRWNSQSFTVDGVLLRATATVLTQPDIEVSNTYRAIGEGA
jgi:hypothetical protein